MQRGSEENRPPVHQKPTLGKFTWAFSQREEGSEGLLLGGSRAARGGGQRASPPVPAPSTPQAWSLLPSSAAPGLGGGGAAFLRDVGRASFLGRRARGAEDRRTLTGPVPGPVCAVPPRRPWGQSPKEGLVHPQLSEGGSPGLPRTHLPPRLPLHCVSRTRIWLFPAFTLHLSQGREFRGRRSRVGFQGSGHAHPPREILAQRAPKTTRECPQSKDPAWPAP